jgi:hypothetical protein
MYLHSYLQFSLSMLQFRSRAENTAIGIRHADHMAPSVGIVRSRTQETEFSLVFNATSRKIVDSFPNVVIGDFSVHLTSF